MLRSPLSRKETDLEGPRGTSEAGSRGFCNSWGVSEPFGGWSLRAVLPSGALSSSWGLRDLSSRLPYMEGQRVGCGGGKVMGNSTHPVWV